MPEWSQTSSKLDEAMNLLEEAIDGGHRVLVFSQFVDLLSLARAHRAEALDYCYLDGGCSTKSRQESIRVFRHEAVPLFLIISPRARVSTDPGRYRAAPGPLVEPGGGGSGRERSGPPHGPDPW